MNRHTLAYIYIIFCTLAFITTATAKLFSDFSHPLMNSVDPVFFFIKAKYLLIFISAFEIGLSIFLLIKLITNRPMDGVKFILWICMLFVLYRIAFLFSPSRLGTCKCFGVGSFFGFMEEKSDLYSLILLGVMLLGGIILQLWEWNAERNNKNLIFNTLNKEQK